MPNKKTKKNVGKIFEDSIAKSCPGNILVKKLADNASGWSGGDKTRFASKNECDFIMHDENTGLFYGLELKCTEGPSFTFWRKDFEEDGKKRTYQIKKNQILGLEKWDSSHSGVFGFVFNFKSKGNATYFVFVSDFLEYTKTLSKNRVNIDDVKQMSPITIQSKKLKINYKYDMSSFFKDMPKQLEMKHEKIL